MSSYLAARPEDVKLFATVEDIPVALWEDALLRPPKEVINACGVEHDNAIYSVPFIGGPWVVDLKARSISAAPGQQQADFQAGMVLLSYLAKGQDIGLAGRMVSGRELNGGELFFRGPHSFRTEPVINKYGSNPQAFVESAIKMGAEADKEGSSGYSIRWLVLPNINIGAILYPEDKEFGAEVTYTFDAYAHYHLPLDSIWGLINIIAERL